MSGAKSNGSTRREEIWVLADSSQIQSVRPAFCVGWGRTVGGSVLFCAQGVVSSVHTCFCWLVARTGGSLSYPEEGYVALQKAAHQAQGPGGLPESRAALGP